MCKLQNTKKTFILSFLCIFAGCILHLGFRSSTGNWDRYFFATHSFARRIPVESKLDSVRYKTKGKKKINKNERRRKKISHFVCDMKPVETLTQCEWAQRHRTSMNVRHIIHIARSSICFIQQQTHSPLERLCLKLDQEWHIYIYIYCLSHILRIALAHSPILPICIHIYVITGN